MAKKKAMKKKSVAKKKPAARRSAAKKTAARKSTRRHSRLAGTPAQHAKSAKAEAAGAIEKYKMVERFAARGNCDSAFDAFVSATSREGRALANDAESGHSMSVSETGKLVDAGEAAGKAFKRACVIR